MNYVSVAAVTEEVARGQAAEKSGYAPQTIGRMVLAIGRRGNSRQDAYVFETSNDVTAHPRYARARLSEAFDLATPELDDGPVLLFGPEVTVGG